MDKPDRISIHREKNVDPQLDPIASQMSELLSVAVTHALATGLIKPSEDCGASFAQALGLAFGTLFFIDGPEAAKKIGSEFSKGFTITAGVYGFHFAQVQLNVQRDIPPGVEHG